MNDLLIENRDRVLWLTLNRPDRRNALNDALLSNLTRAIRETADNRAIRAIVLTGSGDKVFCAGGDLKAADADSGSPFDSDVSQADNPFISLFKAVEACRIPIVGRINGHALGGGMGLLCMCDMAVGVEDALLATPEVKVGLFPMMILSYLLRLVPRRKLLEMSITGEPWRADQALELGLLNYVVPREELDAKVDWLLERILDKSPTAIRLGKQALHAIQDMSLPETFQYTQLMIDRMAGTADAREGFAAFREKRKPSWPGL